VEQKKQQELTKRITEMSKVKLTSAVEITGVEYEAGDILDLATVTADKLVQNEKAKYVGSDEVVDIPKDSFVENYSPDQPLEDHNDD